MHCNLINFFLKNFNTSHNYHIFLQNIQTIIHENIMNAFALKNDKLIKRKIKFFLINCGFSYNKSKG